jgi:hypothetical protein
MEEVICPHCGKANLATDRYCHQCLRPLVESTSVNDETDEKDEEVPEWLKRIRELKKVDEDREKDKEKWRQQTLFGQSGESQKHQATSPEKKTATPHTEHVKTGPENKTPLPLNLTTGNTPNSTTSSNIPSENSSGDQKDTLPEGFMPFEE